MKNLLLLLIILLMNLGWGTQPDWQNHVPSYYTPAPPDWQDDPGYYVHSSFLVAGVVQSNENDDIAPYTDDFINIAAEGDMFAAFDSDGKVCGLATQLVPDFGPYDGQIVYEMTIRSNNLGEMISFKYYDNSKDRVLSINASYEFVITEQIGDLFDAELYDIVFPHDFQFNQSTLQGFYFFDSVTINGNDVDPQDWVGTFVENVYGSCSTPEFNSEGWCNAMGQVWSTSTDEVCVGAMQWDESQCNSNICAVVAMGSDGYESTEGYMSSGDDPIFKIYDTSENKYYDATPSENIPWVINGYPNLDYLSATVGSGCSDENACNYNPNAILDDGSCEYYSDPYCDCNDNIDLGCGCGEPGPSGCDETCGSTLENDECGVCDGDNSSCLDCAGVPNGEAVYDNCGEECITADPSADCSAFCDADSSNDCAQGCDGSWGDSDNVLVDDACGVCDGDGSTCLDCAGVENGNHWESDCGCVAANNSGDDCDDQCGVPDGDNSSCADGGDAPDLFNVSAESSMYTTYYFIESVAINGTAVAADDWVGAFYGNMCVGAAQWDENNEMQCSDGVCSVSVLGDDGSAPTAGYPTEGDLITFMIYDASEDTYYEATPSVNLQPNNIMDSFVILGNLNNIVSGCMDPNNCNYLAYATDNDPSSCLEVDECGECGGTSFESEYNCDGVPLEFISNQSTQQAFYYFDGVYIDNEEVSADDWVGVFNGNICVGAQMWDILLCFNGVCEVTAMGDDGNEWTAGYLQVGDIPTFKVFDASENNYYDAVTLQVPWENLATTMMGDLNVFRDCNGDLGGSAVIDDCGDCVLGNTGLEYNYNDPDQDEICNAVDDCPYDFHNDIDEDGICGDVDDCPYDFHNDIDEDGICGDVDNCEGGDDNLDSDGDGIPDACDVDIQLDGLDLISFYALPENNSTDNIFANITYTDIAIMGEGSSANYIVEGDYWVGTLMTIEPEDGYWIKVNENIDFTVEGSPTNPLTEYSLHVGSNLISYPFAGYAPIEETIPENVQESIIGILGEGESAMYTDSGWIGGLLDLSGSKGYWFIVSEAVDFTYNPPVEGSARKASPIRTIPVEYSFNQSTKQAFYFVNSAIIDEYPLDTEDLIIAYNGDVIVGSRYWYGEVTDVPAMGADVGEAYAGYCTSGDKISFKVWDHSKQRLVDMDTEYKITWNNLDMQIINMTSKIIPGTHSLDKAYPNPFNPVTSLSFALLTDSEVKLSIHNLQGREVASLVNGNMDAGYHAITWNADNQSSGVYFVKMIAGEHVITQKLMLVK